MIAKMIIDRWLNAELKLKWNKSDLSSVLLYLIIPFNEKMYADDKINSIKNLKQTWIFCQNAKKKYPKPWQKLWIIGCNKIFVCIRKEMKKTHYISLKGKALKY